MDNSLVLKGLNRKQQNWQILNVFAIKLTCPDALYRVRTCQSIVKTISKSRNPKNDNSSKLR